MESKHDRVIGQIKFRWLIIIISGFALTGILGAIAYFQIWHTGDGKAQAFSGLLAFIAALASSAVTVVYVFLTSASLREAQASIDLQRNQLKQMKASVDFAAH